jgi:hypothetical protein
LTLSTDQAVEESPVLFHCLTVLSGQILNVQEGWCDSQGTLEAIRVKLEKRQEGAIKRERAIAYVYSQQIEGVPKCNV